MPELPEIEIVKRSLFKKINKAKIVNINIPLKVKTYIEKNLGKEISHFKKKYKLEFNIIADNNQMIPEYKIELLNKNKKIIKK